MAKLYARAALEFLVLAWFVGSVYAGLEAYRGAIL